MSQDIHSRAERDRSYNRVPSGPLSQRPPGSKPVADVLAALDAQYKADGRHAVYFLAPDQPIAPHLNELLGPIPVEEQK